MDKVPSYKDRQIDFRKENVKLLQEIIPANNSYEAEQNYEILIEQTNEDLRKSGHSGIEDNKINPLLKGILKLIKK